jgi:hypothetical protein
MPGIIVLLSLRLKVIGGLFEIRKILFDYFPFHLMNLGGNFPSNRLPLRVLAGSWCLIAVMDVSTYTQCWKNNGNQKMRVYKCS